MARSLTAYLERASVPDFQALKACLKALKLPLDPDPDYVPFETAGYLPCTLDGEDAGFDLRFKTLGEAADPPEPVRVQLGARDTAMVFKWGGDPREDAAASFVCAALAGDFGALIQDGDGETLLGKDALLQRAIASMEM